MELPTKTLKAKLINALQLKELNEAMLIAPVVLDRKAKTVQCLRSSKPVGKLGDAKARNQ